MVEEGTPRCLSTLEELDEEGYSEQALERLTDGAPLPSALEFSRDQFPMLRQQLTRRMSISGVQDKLSLKLEQGKLIPTDEGATYILKPIPSTLLPRWTEDVPANEHLTMQIAEQVMSEHELG